MALEFKDWLARQRNGRSVTVVMGTNGDESADAPMHLHLCAVDEHMRGQGLGRAAMIEIMRLSDDIGVTVMLEAPGQAIQLWYAKMGFVPQAVSRGEYGMLMQRQPRAAAVQGNTA